MKSWNKPTDKDIELILKNLNGNLKYHFFSKLENPLWVEPLQKQKDSLLNPCFVKNEDGTSQCYWEAAPYLIKISSYAPDESYRVIKPLVEKNLKNNYDINGFVIQVVIQIANNFPYENLEYTKEIAEAFLSWLNKSTYISDWLDIKEVSKFLVGLKEKKLEGLAFKILSSALALSSDIISKERPDLGSGSTRKKLEVDIKTKFSLSQGMDTYYYEELLKKAKEIFTDNYNLFHALCLILQALVENEKDLDQKICFHRSAIENHSQDQYNNDPEYLLISSIRDIAESTINNDKSKFDKILQDLEKVESDIFKRIILHLLIKFANTKRKSLITRYLTSKDFFQNTNLHHEYYLLLNQEFKNLSIANQEIILGFIENGPKDASWIDNKKEKDSYIEYWKFKKLYCIKDDLPEKEKKQFQKLAEENNFENPEHPEFLHYMTGGFVGNIAPKEESDINKMTLDDVIDYLKEWKSEGGFSNPTKAGLADLLEKDIDKNPQKYLVKLEVFKEIQEPTYIRHLFQALSRIKSKSTENWTKIIDIASWSLDQECVRGDKHRIFDEDPDWSWCHKEVARLIVNSIKQKNESQQKALLSHADTIFNILKCLALKKDSYLKTKDLQNDDDRYYNRAINSLHGEALSAIIEYALWLGKNNKKKKASSDITPLLDILLDKSSYLETWSVFGRYLPWIDLIDSNWTSKNLDKILPEDGGDKFNAAWLTYINFVQPFTDIFGLLQRKYLYVLQNHLYANSKEREVDRSIGHHIANYYARKKIEIDDDIMTALFSIKENEKERTSLFSFIGRGIKAEKEKPSLELIKRFSDLWEWRVKNIKNHEKEHSSELEQFVWWYKSKCFEKDWAIDHLYEVLIIHGIKPKWNYIDEELKNDIAIKPEKIWKIVKKLTFDSQFSYFHHRDLVKYCVTYIDENGSDNLKKDKDDFVSEAGEKFGAQVFDEISS